MKGLGKIAFINLIILLIYSTVVGLLEHDPYKITLAFGMLLCLNIHTITLIILGVISVRNKDKHKNKLYAITVGLIWLIGLSTCFGVAIATN